MIHHCDVVATPRRVTVIPAVPAAEPSRMRRAFLGLLSGIGLLLTLVAASLGAQPARPARPTADSAKAAPVRNIAWTSNKRSFAVGDIIRVVVDEYALAQANKDNTNSASRRRQLDVGINPPQMGTGTGGLGAIDGSMEAGDGSTSQQRGNATRGTRYDAEIPVRVVAVTPDGLLQVKGTKLIDVDKNKQTLTLSGFVRPLDVNSRDAVGSDAIADMQLAYASKGSLGKPKSGIITRIVGLLWP
ncbi:MAG: flagellar basal body L-ring protein FlgH [Gemmatimonadetes bacterium]|jgi:flagellar L-ring protein precursor FlgH|nr:flagellar basal body L-ring protein FlgH [Gemmatimonadota bacterium]MBP9105352.1 flagellar basal body L-ring protein FlgH [Gemmatimonadaceae bacterium]MBK6843587.1 flagellar basal body L-ring protein FlgH [Gemmatimonadota bacterium]MBK7833319.1 flagellar basal body L-ring protein FlgH [Gemmatimonadota bacterium]MBK8057546.1 flagellar basal body L-ring protein FlgH [Gemmatimonadota bacterium]